MNDPASTSPAARDARALDELDELRGQFPAYLIDREPDRSGRGPRYVAVARDRNAFLRCVITPDPAELAAELAAGQADAR